ncbi:MAG: sodium:solute symporter [Candidatus Krumholzibacteriia bacterium]
MNGLDWAIVLLYAVLIIGIGTLSSRRQTGTDEYFRGSRRLPWWAIGISIIATAFSAASLLGGPGEGYGHGFLWIQLQLGDLLGYLLVCAIFIPVFVRLNLTTAYEYLESRFDAKTRSLGALCFALFVVVRLGALLYGAALVFSETAGVALSVAILAVGVVSILYTFAGGIAAVIWTDVLQFFMILIGVSVCLLVVAANVDGGLLAISETARQAGRLRAFDPAWNPGSIRTLPTALIAYGILAFAVAGTNQQSVQRYVSCPDARSAQKAAMLAWLTGLIGVAAALCLGVFLFGFYQSHPGRLPEDVRPDTILPIFIANELPAGVAGLLVAAVFAAAMSSIDSALHSLSTSGVVDFYRRYLRRGASEHHYLRVARHLVLFWGMVGIAMAFYVARTGESLLPFLVEYTSYFIGPVLGLFVLGVLVGRANGNGAFWGALASVAALILTLRLGPWAIPGIWFCAITAPLTVVFGLLLSLPGKAPVSDPANDLATADR